MRKLLHIFGAALLLAGCSSTGAGQGDTDSQYRSLELAAAGNLQCAWENQARCSHMIENRSLMARFFAPETLGGLNEPEKQRGRRITTKFVVEAAAAINQCRRVTAKSVTIVKDVRISEKGYRVEGTAPLNASSSCFLTPDPENP